MRRWQARQISNPPPSAVPLIAATNGFFAVSIRRNRWCRSMKRSKRLRMRTSSVSPLAISASSHSRSAPAIKAGLPLVTTTPLVSESDKAPSTAAANSPSEASFITFIERPGMSQVMTAMPSSPRAKVRFVMTAPSDALDDRRRPHPGTDAQGYEGGAEPGPLQFVQHGAEDHRTGGAERMTHRDGTAIDVKLFGIELEQLLIKEHHSGEGLVELEQIDVGRGHPGTLQYLARDLLGPGQHDAGLRADRREGPDPGTRLEPHRCARLARTEQHRGRAVDDPRGIAAVVDMLHRLDLRVALHRDRVEPEIGTELGERRLQPAQRLHRRPGTHMLVAFE